MLLRLRLRSGAAVGTARTDFVVGSEAHAVHLGLPQALDHVRVGGKVLGAAGGEHALVLVREHLNARAA